MDNLQEVRCLRDDMEAELEALATRKHLDELEKLVIALEEAKAAYIQ